MCRSGKTFSDTTAPYQNRLVNLERIEPGQFPKLADYDRNFQRELAHKRFLKMA